MGASVSFLGALGNDYYSEAKNFCKKENIKPFLPIKAEKTAYASIITDSKGETRVTVYQGAKLCEDDVDSFEEEISSADILLINNEVPEEVNIKAAKIAKENGTKIILNPAPARNICPYLLENVDIFTPNEFEASVLSEKENLIITLGEKGCFIKENKETIPSFKIDTVVDTTGAGDTFNGALATFLGDGFSLKKAVEIATIASGISVTKKYAVSSIPTKEEISKHYIFN
jgi:ribokinase